MSKKATIIKADEVGPEILAQAIVDVSIAAKVLLDSRLELRTVALLIKDNLPSNAKLGLKDIESVLLTAANLHQSCVKKAKST